MAYIANTPDDTSLMLRAIGLDSLDQLFDLIPHDLRRKAPLRVPPALSELELTDQIGAILAPASAGTVTSDAFGDVGLLAAVGGGRIHDLFVGRARLVQ